VLVLKLHRSVLTKRSTIGTLDAYVDGVKVYSCKTLEDTHREIAGAPVSEWKIKLHTAIPAGLYQVIINFSNRFKKEMPLLLGVPGFEGVRIHKGVDRDDTAGCILVGVNLGPGPDRINSCQPAIDEIMKLLRAHPGATIEVI